MECGRNVRAHTDAISRAGKSGLSVVLVKHVADPARPAPFFVENTEGVRIHPDILAATPDVPIVVKHHAGAFRKTGLNAVLDDVGTDEILVCGMQTRNGVSPTAISNKVTRYKTAILSDCCTAETKTVHAIALSGFGDIVHVSITSRF